MRVRLRVPVALLWIAVSLSAPAVGAADKRFALLIGNQSYDTSVGVLKNPHNDIAIVGEALKRQGFDVLPLVKDARRSGILGAVRELTGRLNAAGAGAVGFLYYSGHGAAEKDTNTNYLIPVDAKDPGSAAFWDESLKLDDVLRLLDSARAAVKFVVFDACRNELQLPTRDTSKGLVPVAEQQGLFVAYASAPGRTASDRGEKSGPYAAALAKEFAQAGLDHLNLFQNVKEAVISSTGGSQHPWESNGLSRRVFLTGEPTTPADMALWEKVQGSDDPGELKRYLNQFPKGVFASTATLMIERFTAEAAQRKAAAQLANERMAQDAKQSAELRAALEEARKAREASQAADAQRAAAEAAAQKAQMALSAPRSGPTATTSGEKEVELAALTEKAKRANDELQASQVALAAAEAKREAAEQAAKEAQRVAALAPARAPAFPEPPKLSGPFSGYWTLSVVSKNCMVKSGVLHMMVDNGAISVAQLESKVKINESGAFKFSIPARSDGKPVAYSGKLSGDTGSGTFGRTDGGCSGTFSATRR